MPLISLICTTYNLRSIAWLDRTIKSVNSQSFTDWELIIVSDGCPAEIRNHLKYLVSSYKDCRIKLILNSRLGRSKQLRLAHDYCNGDYIGWIDDDDYLVDTNTLSICADRLNKNKNLSMVFTKASNRPWRKYYQFTSNLINFDTFNFRLFRSEDWYKLGGYDTNLDYAIDWDWSLRLEEIGFAEQIDILGYYYRIHPDRISDTRRNEQEKCSLIAVNNALKRRGRNEELIIKCGDNKWRLFKK
jgi:glycosyltransferase involved in cell wall biosynthesis